VEWLLANAPVDSRWCLIHATHMTDEETDALARSGATAGLCPITEANLGDGFFNGRRFVQSGGHFGIGTDSNVLIDAAAELRQLEYAQRLRDRARNRIKEDRKSTGRTLFDKALRGGARALASGPAGIAMGASADMISLNPGHVMLEGRADDRILDAWIFAARHSAIDCVWARGVKQVSGGRHCRCDETRQRFGSVMRRLLA
jgi:formiminoglutamate deiminase